MPFTRLSPGPSWRTVGGADDISAGSARKLKYLPVSKLMVYVTGTPDNGPSSVGVLRYSDDFGVTWQDAAPPAGCDGCLDIIETSGGTIWGLFYDSTTPGDPDGYTVKAAHGSGINSWTVAYTYAAGKQAFNIASSGSLKVAFVGSNGTTYDLVVSTNAGTTWTVKDTGYNAEGDADTPLIHWKGDRIVLYLTGSSAAAGVVTRLWGAPSGSGDTNVYFYDIGTDSWTIFDTSLSGLNPAASFPPSQFAFPMPSGDVGYSFDGMVTWTDKAGPGGAGGPAQSSLVFNADGGVLLYLDYTDGSFWSSDLPTMTWNGPIFAGSTPGSDIHVGIAAHPTDADRFIQTFQSFAGNLWSYFSSMPHPGGFGTGGTSGVITGDPLEDFLPYGCGALPLWIDDGTTDGIIIIACTMADGKVHFFMNNDSGAGSFADEANYSANPTAACGFDDYAFFAIGPFGAATIVRRNPDTSYDTFDISAALVDEADGIVVANGSLYIAGEFGELIRVDNPKTSFDVTALASTGFANWDSPNMLGVS